MGGDRHEKNKRDRLPPFVPMLINTMDTRAYRALSHGARSTLVSLKRRYSSQSHNNGRLFLSLRMAAKEIGSHRDQVGRWLRELEHYGFIVKTSPGCLGVDGRGKAPHWRLTELGYMRDPPTRDFDMWDGTPFKDRETESRPRN
jgi:hypothetical protein